MKLTIHQTTVGSTAIDKWAFYSDSTNGEGTLFVQFVGGAEYAYSNCPLTLVAPMLTQASVGRYFAHTVKPYFTAEQVVKMNDPVNA
jgi:hypothetical protein